MKIKELIEQLNKLPLDDEIVITSLDDYFYCDTFEVASLKENECQEIIQQELGHGIILAMICYIILTQKLDLD